MKSTCVLTIVVLSILMVSVLSAAAGSGKPAAAGTEKEARPAKRKGLTGPMAPIEDAPGLPRVLLIGDSISIGYTVPTRKLLAGKVNVHRIPENGGHTAKGLEQLTKWLGDGKWDAIHFNWGLHDLKYLKDGKLDLSGEQLGPPPQYEKNLRELVKRLKKTGAKLIWAATTPVPEGAGGRKAGDAARYNQIAAKVMAEAKVPTNDLHAFALPRLKQIQRPKNVHFLSEGSEALARQAADHILRALGKPPLPKPPAKTKAPR